MQPHQQRVVDEKSALDGNINRLAAFIGQPSPVFTALPEAEQERLRVQLSVMGVYSEILGRRIAAFPA